jgi:hypothetical protein
MQNVIFTSITLILKIITLCENANKTHKLLPKMVVEKPKQNIMFMAPPKKKQQKQ